MSETATRGPLPHMLRRGPERMPELPREVTPLPTADSERLRHVQQEVEASLLQNNPLRVIAEKLKALAYDDMVALGQVFANERPSDTELTTGESYAALLSRVAGVVIDPRKATQRKSAPSVVDNSGDSGEGGAKPGETAE